MTNPSKGVVNLVDATTGQFTYTPTADFFGTDYFVYQLSDGVQSSEPATVTVTILAVNDPPSFTATAIPAVAESRPSELKPAQQC